MGSRMRRNKGLEQETQMIKVVTCLISSYINTGAIDKETPHRTKRPTPYHEIVQTYFRLKQLRPNASQMHTKYK